MFLKSIGVESFRNLSGEIDWAKGLNVLYGNNGQGKTNWLEAIQLLAQAKSFRAGRLHEVIAFSRARAFVQGQVHRGDSIDRHLRVAIQDNTRQTFINGKREPIARYLAHLHVVSFTTNELEVVRGGPEARRAFIDRGVMSLQPGYTQTVIDYHKVLKQKKRLLDQAANEEIDFDQLREFVAPWNEQLVARAAEIHHGRIRYTRLLQEALDESLFGDALSVRYVSSLESKGDLSNYEQLIADRLRLRLEAEAFAGACLIGPHRDDLEIRFGDRNLRSFGSAGQQRSALITLDLAAISVYYSSVKEYPIFLIDDVDAELDGIRIERLLEYLDGRIQTFVTTSKRNYFERFNQSATFYEIREGRATEESRFPTSMMKARSV